MIIYSTNAVLQNIEDNFYYCGIEISKNQFNITDFSKICNKINDLKYQIYQEKAINNLKIDNILMDRISIFKDTDLYILVEKDKLFITIYNKERNEIEPLSKKVFNLFNDRLFINIAYKINKTASQYTRNMINKHDNIITNKNFDKNLIKILNYQENIEKLSNCFYHTYELEFINGYKDYIFTDEELNNSLKEISYFYIFHIKSRD